MNKLVLGTVAVMALAFAAPAAFADDNNANTSSSGGITATDGSTVTKNEAEKGGIIANGSTVIKEGHIDHLGDTSIAVDKKVAVLGKSELDGTVSGVSFNMQTNPLNSSGCGGANCANTIGGNNISGSGGTGVSITGIGNIAQTSGMGNLTQQSVGVGAVVNGGSTVGGL